MPYATSNVMYVMCNANGMGLDVAEPNVVKLDVVNTVG